MCRTISSQSAARQRPPCSPTVRMDQSCNKVSRGSRGFVALSTGWLRWRLLLTRVCGLTCHLQSIPICTMLASAVANSQAPSFSCHPPPKVGDRGRNESEEGTGRAFDPSACRLTCASFCACAFSAGFIFEEDHTRRPAMDVDDSGDASDKEAATQQTTWKVQSHRARARAQPGRERSSGQVAMLTRHCFSAVAFLRLAPLSVRCCCGSLIKNYSSASMCARSSRTGHSWRMRSAAAAAAATASTAKPQAHRSLVIALRSCRCCDCPLFVVVRFTIRSLSEPPLSPH